MSDQEPEPFGQTVIGGSAEVIPAAQVEAEQEQEQDEEAPE